MFLQAIWNICLPQPDRLPCDRDSLLFLSPSHTLALDDRRTIVQGLNEKMVLGGCRSGRGGAVGDGTKLPGGFSGGMERSAWCLLGKKKQKHT